MTTEEKSKYSKHNPLILGKIKVAKSYPDVPLRISMKITGRLLLRKCAETISRNQPLNILCFSAASSSQIQSHDLQTPKWLVSVYLIYLRQESEHAQEKAFLKTKIYISVYREDKYIATIASRNMEHLGL